MGDVLRFNVRHVAELRKWAHDVYLPAPAWLTRLFEVEAYRERAGTPPLSVMPDVTIDSALPEALRPILASDVASHVDLSKSTLQGITLLGVSHLLTPLFVPSSRELLLPLWYQLERVTNLLHSSRLFRTPRPTSAAWVLLDAPVLLPGDKLVSFHYYYQREGTDPGARWHWRSHAPRDDEASS